MKISIRFEGDDVKLSARKFGKLLPEITDEVIAERLARLKKTVSGGYSGGNSYIVPLRARQRYIRTGNYGRSVYVEQEGLTYRIRADAYSPRGYNYGPRLVGNANGAGQAWWAAGRWPNALAEAETELTPMVTELDKRLQAGAESVGL
jgi:hypothetical protein